MFHSILRFLATLPFSLCGDANFSGGLLKGLTLFGGCSDWDCLLSVVNAGLSLVAICSLGSSVMTYKVLPNYAKSTVISNRMDLIGWNYRLLASIILLFRNI